jgi:hypothetical protein
MEPNIPSRVKIALLVSEMDAIHFANLSYWQLGEMATLEPRFEYQRRKDRLEEIRGELVRLKAFATSDSRQRTSTVVSPLGIDTI